eukprot:gene47008-58650_t
MEGEGAALELQGGATSLAALTGLAAFPGAFMTTSLSSAATATALQALKPSPRMPVLFVGHGSPMNAIEDNAWRRSWQAMGAELMARAVQPQLILCVSAHWLTRGGWQLTGMANPQPMPQPRAHVSAIPTYVPGKPPTPRPGVTTYKLSSNENPYPPLPGVVTAATEAAAVMNRYPDMGSTALYDALAARLD